MSAVPLSSPVSVRGPVHGGRQDSVTPQIVATVLGLQRVEGLSDREAVDRFAFDLR